ncbi:hypothetical protein HDG34_003237 [Paraburkholderia sp. HC6.4b]|uniref:hypothetical protein n=1 Tax=unclassified Paraburkholderia TaxID=2615204 RepID=UPI001619EA78|nr:MULTISPECIES: hypothetical protein [unclassified Paraburkholderia]MBB5409296.1 hypothetical protein [Paraburkholderia sp. HC6.4b]MBB5451024.1 hypothetical protein [Paraburkholderia sp. Kb1A]
MCAATTYDTGLAQVPDGNFQTYATQLAQRTSQIDPLMDCSEHDAVLDSIANTAIDAVRRHVAFARSVVAPTIQNLYERVRNSVENLSVSSLLGLEVEVWREPKPVFNTALQSELRKLEDIALDDPPLSMRMPDLTIAELMELIKTGNGGLDADIAEWVATIGDEFFMQVWRDFFQQHMPEDGERNRTFTERVTDRFTGMPVALAVYLLARKLLDEKPPEGVEMPLANYRAQLAGFRNQAGGALTRALERIERALKNGLLVREIAGSKTVVYEPVYRDYLEKGGSNEMLFANALSRPFMMSTTDLLEHKNALASRWATHSALISTAESNQRYNKVIELLELHFRSQLNEATEGEDTTAQNRDTVLKLFRDCLKHVTESDLNDLYAVCLKLVCRARFYTTDAERILTGMELARARNPSLSPREAATASIVDYIAWWVATQMRLASC